MTRLNVFICRFGGNLLLGVFAFLIAPILSFAASDPVGLEVKINNPLSSAIDSLPAFIYEVLHIVLIVGVPLVALAIIYSGFLFVMARGSESKLTEAKNALLYSVIGAAILMGSWIIAQAIQATINDIISTT